MDKLQQVDVTGHVLCVTGVELHDGLEVLVEVEADVDGIIDEEPGDHLRARRRGEGALVRPHARSLYVVHQRDERERSCVAHVSRLRSVRELGKGRVEKAI